MIMEPAHFSKEDILYSFFGSLFLGFTFMTKILFVDLVKVIQTTNLIAILVATTVLVTFEIYYLGYTRVPVKERKSRTFGEFWAKRFITVCIVSLITSLFLIYVYGFNNLFGDGSIVKAVIMIFMPCSMGATFSDLFRKIKF